MVLVAGCSEDDKVNTDGGVDTGVVGEGGVSPGSKLWAVSLGGGKESISVVDVALDKAGNAHVAGNFAGTVRVGGTSLISKMGTDLYLAKVSPEGRFLWARRAGGVGSAGVGAGQDRVTDLVVDASGNVTLTGEIHSLADFGTLSLNGSGPGPKMFTARVSPAGAFSWAVSVRGSINGGNALARTASGAIGVAGYFEETITFDTIPLRAGGGFNYEMFVAKLSSSGKYTWAGRANGTKRKSAHGIAFDASGNAYVAGRFVEQATFGSRTLTSRGDYDAFLAKLSPKGTFLWAVSAGGTKADLGTSVFLDDQGNLLWLGAYQGKMTIGTTTFTAGRTIGGTFLAKVSAAGSVLWARNTDGAVGDIAPSTGGTFYGVGSFNGTRRFGSSTLTARGKDDVVVARYGANGDPVSAVAGGGAGDDGAAGVALDKQKYLVVTGTFEGTGTIFGGTPLNGRSQSDVFIWRLRAF